MRGLRLGLIALLTVGLHSALSPGVLANGVPMITPHLVAAPILIVIVNYPINGLMLYIAIRRGLNRDAVPITWTEGHFPRDFAGAVLQFTLYGALIDTAVFTHVEYGFATASLALGLGLIGVVATCALVCYRYLWLGPRHILLAVFIVCCLNVLGWWLVIYTVLPFFIMVDLPVIALLWVLLIWRVMVRAKRLTEPMVAHGDGRLAAPAGRPVATPPSFKPPASQMDLSNRRMELWLVNAVLFAICVLLSLGLDVV